MTAALPAPAHWRAGQIKHVARVTLGKMLQGLDSGSDVAAPYLRAANIQPDGVIRLEDRKTMFFGEEELDALNLRTGDVVVVEGGIGGFGRAAYVRQDLQGWGFQNSIIRLRPRSGVDGRFLAYYLLAQRARGFIAAYCNIVSMPHLTSEKLAAMPIRIPPPNEQQMIADYLDREIGRIDELVVKQQQLVITLRERRLASVEAAMRVVPGQVREPLGRYARIGNGSTPSRERGDYWNIPHFPWLNSSVVNQELVTKSDNFVSAVALSECHLPRVVPGSVLVGLTGEGRTRGMATLLKIEATVSQHVAYISPRSGWHPEYLLWQIRAKYEDLRSMSDENGSTKGGLTCSALKRVLVYRPDMAAQQQVAETLADTTGKLDVLIGKAELLIAMARERRAALISAAVTGQINVLDAA